MYGQSAHSHQPGLNIDQKPFVICGFKGPVQTSNFSCTEPNVAIKYMKSSTYESIRIGRFVNSFSILYREFDHSGTLIMVESFENSYNSSIL